MKYCPKCQHSYAPLHSLCPQDGEVLTLKDLYGLTGRVVSDKYRIESLMTIGGMSAVYRARQIGVDRQVAFKILLPNLAINNASMRGLFEREARTAGLLTHENIATVHDAGRTPDDLAYIAMEWLEGPTLEQELKAEGQLSYERIAKLLQQTAAALDAAHAEGVIHRDLKPSNIMLVPRADGRDMVKVLDFGLAKILHETAEVQVSSALGTPHYASPEQFRVGEEIDGRADIYALGVILYRMLAGRLPFDVSSIHELIRLHLLESPPPLRAYRPDVPLAVENLLNRMLAKTPQYRPATASAAADEFEEAVRTQFGTLPKLPPGSPAPVNSHPRPLADTPVKGNGTPGTPPIAFATSFNQSSTAPLAVPRGATFVSVNPGQAAQVPTTPLPAPPPLPKTAPKRFDTGMLISTTQPRKFNRWLVVAAVLVLLGAGTGYRLLRNKPKLTEKDTILLADFINTTGDEVFDKTLKQALTIQLAQSPFLNLLPEDKARETLRFMNRPSDEKITRELALEIAQRSGLKAVLTAQIDKLDRHYALTLETLNSQTGESLTRTQLEAIGKDQVIRTLGQAALQLRGELGESLNTIEKFNAPIEQATTSSLEALKAYSLAYEQLNQRANPREVRPFLQRAIELDPNFAMAHYSLAMSYSTLGLTRLSAEACDRAYNLSSRVSERERLTITALYHALVTGDIEKGLATYKLMAQTYPNSVLPHIGLASLYRQTGQLQRALDEAEAAINLDSQELVPHLIRATTLLRLNRLDEAKQKLDQSLALRADGALLRTALFQLAFLQGNTDLMNAQYAWARERRRVDKALDWQAQAAAATGRLKEAATLWQQASLALPPQRGANELSAPFALSTGITQALAGQTAAARKSLDSALTRTRDSFVYYSTISSQPFGPLAFALSGARDQALSLSDELARNQPQNSLANNIWLPITKAFLENQEGRYEQALETLKLQAQSEGCSQYYSNWARGEALFKLKRGYEAEIEFKKIVANRGLDATSLLYPLAHLAIARTRVLIGDTDEARRYYHEFFKLWRDADPDLPVVVAAKKELAVLK
jgi:serine/threonine protein kinase/tetratricopeptide (TPR) repeat protein